MNLCSYNSKTRNERHVMPIHHGFFVLFQFSEDFIGTHAFGKQLFQNGLCFCFFVSSAALASAFAFFASRDATSFSAFFRAVFFSFRSAFKVSMLAVMDAISAASASFADCFSAICVTKSAVTVLGLFLLPLVLGIIKTSRKL